MGLQPPSGFVFHENGSDAGAVQTVRVGGFVSNQESKDQVDNEVDEIVEKLSEEDQKLLDEALANLMGFIEQETTIGYWVEEDQDMSDKNRQPSSD